MPRSLRDLPAGCLAHALNRGNDRRTLFEVFEDFEDFLELMRWAKARCTIRIIAYCLMPNHWHFVLWPRTDHDVTIFMGDLTSAHAKRRRWQSGTIGQGHIYQDRYRAFVIHHEAYYFSAMSYVEGNARRANLVRRARDWRWSSLYERTEYPRGLLDEGPLRLPYDWADQVDQPLPIKIVEDFRTLIQKR
jgi:putative transposase